MNPDTNKFERLASLTDEELSKQNRALSNALEGLTGTSKTLLRPNGEPVPKHWTVLRVGQDVVVENYTFTVAHIGESHLLLEPKGPILIEGGQKCQK
jgi:hypothetical protein